MSHELRRSMYFQMPSDIKHFSHCIQITAESSGLVRGEGTEQKNPFWADLTTVSSRALNQHPLYFMHRYSAFAPELILQPKLFGFAPNIFTRQGPI